MGSLWPMKNAPRWKLRVMAAASSSVSGRGRLLGLNAEVEPVAVGVGVVFGAVEGAGAVAEKVL